MCPQFGCCGGVTYTDWSQNVYFNCNKDNPSRERCSVPFSCCVISQEKVVFFYKLYWKVLYFSCFYPLIYIWLLSLCTDGYQHYVRSRHAGFRLRWSWKPHSHKRLHRQTGKLDSQQPVLHWRYCTGNGHTTGRTCVQCAVLYIPANTHVVLNIIVSHSQPVIPTYVLCFVVHSWLASSFLRYWSIRLKTRLTSRIITSNTSLTLGADPGHGRLDCDELHLRNGDASSGQTNNMLWKTWKRLHTKETNKTLLPPTGHSPCLHYIYQTFHCSLNCSSQAETDRIFGAPGPLTGSYWPLLSSQYNVQIIFCQNILGE